MQPVVETVSGLERRVELAVAMADVEQEVQAQLKRVQRQAKAPGFRPGKVPMSMLERSHAPGIRMDVINDKVGSAFEQAVNQAELRVAGMPRIEPKSEGVEADTLAFVATFEVFPQVELPDLAALEVERAEVSVGDPEVERTVEILRQQRVNYQPAADRAAQDNDRVTIDFEGKIDDVAFEGGTAADFPFVLGQGRMLPEFEEAVRGLKAGESKTFPLTFPEDYGSAAVAGKTAQFIITVKEVAEGVLPEVDAEFAKSLGQAEGDIAKLRDDIRGNLEREVAARAQARTKSSVMDALVKAVSFDVPKSLIESETESRVKAAREELRRRGLPNADDIPVPADAFTPEAERRVRLGLTVSELVKQNDLQAKPDQVRAKIEDFARNYESPAEVVRYYLSDRERLAEVEAIVVEDNVVALVLEKAKVTDKPVSFDELMGQNGQNGA
ncbi:MAG: trigger factor [Pigmentiphaga sp.]|nr:trigger factor [Pigmentiphaga sp.]